MNRNQPAAETSPEQPSSALEIREGTVEEAVALSREIPEFNDPYPIDEYRRRLSGVNHLVLVAYQAGRPVGFKVGYERDSDGSFYSWMGGVHPRYRRLGIARRLAEQQEAWAVSQGYHTLRLKTRRKYRAMLQFALGSGFRITDVIPKTPAAESRILLEKPLTLTGSPATTDGDQTSKPKR
jgi:GNAT superfamily N-acetyltransferase